MEASTCMRMRSEPLSDRILPTDRRENATRPTVQRRAHRSGPTGFVAA